MSQVFSTRVMCLHYVIIFLISEYFTACPRCSDSSHISQESNFHEETALLGLIFVLYISSGLPEHLDLFSGTDTLDSLLESIGLILEAPQPDYKQKKQARTDTGTGSFSPDFQELPKAALAA